MRRPRSFLSPTLLALALAAAPLSGMAQHKQVLEYAGVNLAGAEFKSSQLPGKLFKDYTYPSEKDFDYLASKGMNVVRLPFLWERLQPQAGGELDPDQLHQLQVAVDRASARGITVVLDVHNYGRYRGKQVGTDEPAASLTDLWRRLASQKGLANNPKVIFGLMNEPHGISPDAWAKVAQAALDAVRKAGAKNLVLVPGTAWSGAHSWNKGAGSNGQALLAIRDPARNMAFEVHQYLDKDSSGTKDTCGNDAQVGVRRLEDFTRWLRTNHRTGFLGEFGASRQPTCMEALDNMLGYMQKNGDVWRGWTYWAAGAWWPSSYMFTVQPGKDGSEKPQMDVLSRRAREVTGHGH